MSTPDSETPCKRFDYEEHDPAADCKTCGWNSQCHIVAKLVRCEQAERIATLTARVEQQAQEITRLKAQRDANIAMSLRVGQILGPAYDGVSFDVMAQEITRLREALESLIIDANRLCDRMEGGTYEDDCRRTLAKAKEALK